MTRKKSIGITRQDSLDAEELWKNVGLEKLHQSLAAVSSLASQFEQTLRSLPSCHECARLTLVEQIQKTGENLSTEVLSLSLLAKTLENGLKEAEAGQEKLVESCPPPCECSEGKCTCHHSK